MTLLFTFMDVKFKFSAQEHDLAPFVGNSKAFKIVNDLRQLDQTQNAFWDNKVHLVDLNCVSVVEWLV